MTTAAPFEYDRHGFEGYLGNVGLVRVAWWCCRGLEEIVLRDIACLCLLALGLGGCAAPVLEAANIAKDKVVINENIDAAKAGDAEAQFNVGDALCCSLDDDKSGFYDTQKSVGWLCASAAQGYGPAAFKLGKIYSGDRVDGVRLMRRVAQAVAGSDENLPVAYAWMSQAWAQNVDNAQSRAESLWQDLTPAQKQEAKTMVEEGQPFPCAWNEVIPATN